MSGESSSVVYSITNSGSFGGRFLLRGNVVFWPMVAEQEVSANVVSECTGRPGSARKWQHWGILPLRNGLIILSVPIFARHRLLQSLDSERCSPA